MSRAVDRLILIMQKLRAPDGCPWDREQDLQSLKGYLLEEAYEVIEAVESGDPEALKEELGDLLLQIVFMAQIAGEEGAFTMEDVAEEISEKMIRRHPHVFGKSSVNSTEEVLKQWEKIKTEERRTQPKKDSALAGIPKILPALLKAYRMTQKASGMGFDWEKPTDVILKLREELEELEEAVGKADSSERIREEMGDFLFSTANLSRHLDVEPETALIGSNDRFLRRFQLMEEFAREEKRELSNYSLDELDMLWEKAKKHPAD